MTRYRLQIVPRKCLGMLIIMNAYNVTIFAEIIQSFYTKVTQSNWAVYQITFTDENYSNC